LWRARRGRFRPRAGRACRRRRAAQAARRQPRRGAAAGRDAAAAHGAGRLGAGGGAMNISEIFIRRPIATILLSVALIFAGLFAYRFLPVAALPRVDFPTISVSAQLPGASPETMSTSVA